MSPSALAVVAVLVVIVANVTSSDTEPKGNANGESHIYDLIPTVVLDSP